MRRALLSLRRGSNSLGPKNYALKRERASRRAVAWITRHLEQITRPKEKGAVGALRSFLSSTRGAESLGRENYTLERERAVGGWGPALPDT